MGSLVRLCHGNQTYGQGVSAISIDWDDLITASDIVDIRKLVHSANTRVDYPNLETVLL